LYRNTPFACANNKNNLNPLPKENTHLYFAHSIPERLPDKRLGDLIRHEIASFYFGSIIPDTFYYSPKKEVIAISEILHGRSGNPTNEMIFSLLKVAKETREERDFVFALGFITHCVLDIVFHPVIYYLSGNYYDSDKEKADDAVYLHRHLETDLDRQVNQEFYYEKLIKLQLLDVLHLDEVLERKFKLKKNLLASLLKRKRILLALSRTTIFYKFIYFLYAIGVIKHKLFLGIFYANLKDDNRSLPTQIDYRDIITGAPLHTTVEELFEKAMLLAIERITVASDYYHGKIKSEEAKKIIRGESLNTGRENCPVTEIKYYN
jgi:hypothetical protein